MEKKTKIVCTIGPACKDPVLLEKLISNGMDVARFNFSHADYEDVLKTLNHLHEIRKKLNIPLSTMLDTKGPEVRIYGYDQPIKVDKNEEYLIKSIDMEKDKKILKSNDPLKTKTFYTNLPKIDSLVNQNDKILLMDGYFECFVTSKNRNQVTIRFETADTLRPKAHLTIPNVDYPLEFLSDKDKQDIIFAVKNNFDYIALSFVRSSEDLVKVKRIILDTNIDSSIKLIAKIEHRKALQNIDEIIAHSDGIMVARGDLGVELPLEEVPVIQKKIIEKCYLSGKPVITATQMLESMIENPLPTRAEASDVANACYDMTSAVMLSGETAIGNFPDLVVKIMNKILTRAEQSIDYSKFFYSKDYIENSNDLTTIITYNAVSTAYQCGAKAILAVTKSGYSARMISKLRPGLPIIVFTYEESVYHQMALNWGITTILIKKEEIFEKLIENIKSVCLEKKLVEKGDLVVIVSGLPLGKQGTTNMIRVESIGKTRLSGQCINPKTISHNCTKIETLSDLKSRDIDNKIVILKNFRESYIPLLKYTAGIIMETADYENELRLLAFAYDIPVVLNAFGIFDMIKEGSLIEINGEKNIVAEI